MSTPVLKLLDSGPVDRIAHLRTICDALGITTSSKTKKTDFKDYIYNHITVKPECEALVREMIIKINDEAKKTGKSESVSSQLSPNIDDAST